MIFYQVQKLENMLKKIAFANNPDLVNVFLSPGVEAYSSYYVGKDYVDLNENEKKKVDADYKKIYWICKFY